MFHIRRGVPVPPKKSKIPKLGYSTTAQAMEPGDSVLFEVSPTLADQKTAWALARKRGLVMYTQIVRGGNYAVTRTVPDGIQVWKLHAKETPPHRMDGAE